MRKVHWLGSYPKSGNTWVRLFLAAYRYGVANINQAAELMKGDNNLPAYQAASPVPINSATTHEALGLRYAALMHLVSQHAVDPVILKTHNAAATLNGVELIWEPITEASVYLVRDPRDVALSYSRHVGKSVDDTIELMGQELARTTTHDTEVAHFLSSWSNHVESWLAKDNVTVIRYEDLLKDPVPGFVEIVKAVGYDLDEERVAAAVDAVAFDKLKQQEKAHGFLEASRKNSSFFHKGKAGRWRDTLTAEQVARIEQDHGKMMQLCGYELSGITESETHYASGASPNAGVSGQVQRNELKRA
jgi:hypothetical protein